MVKRLYKILINTKIVYVGFILVLISGIILIYLDYISITKRTETFRSNYKLNAELLRDKIEREIINSEEKVSNLLNRVPLKPTSSLLTQIWLSEMEDDNHIAKDPFILNLDGGVITRLISSRWHQPSIEPPQINKYFLKDFRQAEKIEFSDQDYKKAVDTYKLLLKFNDPNIRISNIPVSVAALTQLSDIYEITGETYLKFNSLLDLYKKLLSQYWESRNGEYDYYLKTVSTQLEKFCAQYPPVDSLKHEIKLLTDTRQLIYNQENYVRFINRSVLPGIKSVLQNQNKENLQPFHLHVNNDNSDYRLTCFPVQNPEESNKHFVFGYLINERFLIDSIFKKILLIIAFIKKIQQVHFYVDNE